MGGTQWEVICPAAWYVCGVPVPICCCDHRLYQSHCDNSNEHLLNIVHVPLLVVLLVVYQYMSMSTNESTIVISPAEVSLGLGELGTDLM